MFKEIHDIIVEDNARSGVEPSNLEQTQSHSRNSSQGGQQHSLAAVRPLSISQLPGFDTSEIGAPARRRNLHAQSQRSSSLERSSRGRQQPPIQPKPEALHGLTPISNGQPNAVSADSLAERFAQLRPPLSSSQKARETQDQDPVDMPSPTQFTSRSSAEPTSPSQSHSKPSGPRAMPPPPTYLPPHPPKIPLDTAVTPSLPRAPSPTYNPIRSAQTISGIQSLRSTTGSVVGAGGRPPQSAAPSHAPGISEDPYSRNSVDEIDGNGIRPMTVDLPNATAITAEELYDRLQKFSVLLIDVRSREDYDQGHIFSKSIMCIEPISLKSGVPADDLEERLVVSPESEQILFERRNEFDLVVYYDQRTRSNKFLEGPPNSAEPPALRALHDTLYEFNYYKELRRPPAVLIGGLEAWMDLVGRQALLTSRTAALIGIARPRRPVRGSGRPIARIPIASSNSSLEVRKRRLREYNPLDAEESRAWLEKARNEEVAPGEYQQSGDDGDTDSVSSHPGEPASPLVHSYEDFLRRFPEAPAIQQSMVSSRPPQPGRMAAPLPAIPSRPPPAVPRPSYSGVSDRGSSQISPTSRQPVSVQPPLYTSRAITHYLKLPRTGLINFSVTCYMNATIQCLLATIPLSQFFLDNRWRDFTQKNWKGSNGIMPEIYANLIRSLWRNDVQAVRPTSLRSFCARLNREWGADRQQDAKEFFDFLVDCLHEDLNINWNRSPLRPLTTDQEMVRERMPIHQVSKVEWERYTHRESSFIADLFAGQHASRLRCTTCRNTSTTYEAFYSISVEIPRSGRGEIRECLQSYCQEEMLSGDEVWKCPHCKCEREATKRITITRIPQVLVIHFKRFSASKTESARKVHTPIDFPLHGLNMGPYMAATKAEPDTDHGNVDPAITPPFLYDAYAVMRHLGQSGNGGHYIALVKDTARGCWRKFDDDRATDFDPNKLRPDQRLQNEQAYLVFYGRSVAR